MENFKRWSYCARKGEYVETENGGYVKFSDIKEILNSANNRAHVTIALECDISEILLGSYMSDERKASKAAKEIMEKIAQQ